MVRLVLEVVERMLAEEEAGGKAKKGKRGAGGAARGAVRREEETAADARTAAGGEGEADVHLPAVGRANAQAPANAEEADAHPPMPVAPPPQDEPRTPDDSDEATSRATSATTSDSRQEAKQPCIYFWRKGGCRQGEQCRFSHEAKDRTDNCISSDKETSLYKCRMCTHWGSEKGCSRGDTCSFAHGEHELRCIWEPIEGAGGTIEGYRNKANGKVCRDPPEWDPRWVEYRELQASIEKKKEMATAAKAAKAIKAAARHSLGPPIWCPEPVTHLQKSRFDVLTQDEEVDNDESAGDGDGDGDEEEGAFGAIVDQDLKNKTLALCRKEACRDKPKEERAFAVENREAILKPPAPRPNEWVLESDNGHRKYQRQVGVSEVGMPIIQKTMFANTPSDCRMDKNNAARMRRADALAARGIGGFV